MATRVYRANPGESQEQVTEAVGAATTKLAEITIDLNLTGIGGARQITRDEALQCIERMVAKMVSDPWPPA